MESLTHVSMWSEHGWIRISPQKAAKLCYGGGSSSHSGLFMCELCLQSVCLPNVKKQIPHFRHLSQEADKTCPERVFGNAVSLSYRASDYSLPLRILSSRGAYHFEIGFPCTPISILKETDSFAVKIWPKEQTVQPFQYLYPARFQPDGMTWLSVGNVPSSGYKVHTTCAKSELLSCWPPNVRGIDLNGTVFDAGTGNMLSHGADVQTGKSYFILQRKPLTSVPRSIQCQKIAEQEIAQFSMRPQIWCLYRITALDFSESSAKFFMNYRCRLTETPASIRILWPAYVEAPYIIRHKENQLWLYVRGENVETKSFPSANQKFFPCSFGSVHFLQAYERQQILSIGRSEMIQYAYLWRDALDKSVKIPSVSVTDLAGEAIPSGVLYQLPRRNILQIRSQDCDGTISVLQDGVPVGRRLLKAGESVEISSLCYGMEIRVILGLDCLWTVQFQRKQENFRQSDSELARRLERGGGALRPVPHSLGAMSKKLEAYPNVRQWLYRKLREGVMPESSYCLLRHIICGGDSEKENP